MPTKRNEQLGLGTCQISDRAKKYVNQVLESNRLTYGPFSKAFEEKFAALHNCKFALLVNSGTSALRIALGALKEQYNWSDGDEVIIPAVTFIADVNVILSNRLTPVFVDIDPKTYNIDASKIAEKITPRTRCLMPSHLFGAPADMEKIMALAKTHSLQVIEDACESPLARLNGQPVGSFGNVGCYSTYQAHVITTGVGGLATTNDPDTAVLLRSLANHGRDGIYMQIDDDKNKSGSELKQIVERRFTFIRPGYSFRATEMEAALGLAELEENINQQVARRRAIVQTLEARLSKFPALQLHTVLPKGESVHMMYPIVVNKESGVTRDELVTFLEEYNIETRRMLPILDQPFILKTFGDLSAAYPVADHINKDGFYIASHPGVTDKDIEYIGQVFDEFFRTH